MPPLGFDADRDRQVVGEQRDGAAGVEQRPHLRGRQLSWVGGGGRVHRCGDRSTSTRCAGGDTGGGTRRVPRTAWSADADAVGVQVTSARAAAAAGSARSSAAAARAAAAR